MGCDYFADENGDFEIEFRDYKTGGVIGYFRLTGLTPQHPISKELLKGNVR